MGGRHQNFEDLITQTQDMRKTKFDQGGGFFWLPFNAKEGTQVLKTTSNFLTEWKTTSIFL
jgi:hypothetical protein